MDRHEQRRRTETSKPADLVADHVVVRPVDGVAAPLFLGLAQVVVAGDEDAVAEHEKRAGVEQLAVAVDDESRVLGENRRHAEALGQPFRQGAGADVDGEVAAACERIETHVAECFREAAAGVIAHQ